MREDKINTNGVITLHLIFNTVKGGYSVVVAKHLTICGK